MVQNTDYKTLTTPNLLPMQLAEAWTLQDLWMCHMVYGTKILAADSLSPVELLRIGFVVPAYYTDARLSLGLGNF